MPEIHCVYDFRDTPMRVRASFESRADADAWGAAKFGDHAWVPPGEEGIEAADARARIADLEEQVSELSGSVDDAVEAQRKAESYLEDEEIENKRLTNRVLELDAEINRLRSPLAASAR